MTLTDGIDTIFGETSGQLTKQIATEGADKLRRIEGHVYAKYYPDGDFMINTSDYLAEKVAATDTFTMKFKSVCPIDLDFLNSKISAVVTGYTD